MRAMPPLASSARVIWSCRSRACCGLVEVLEVVERGILGGLAIVAAFLVGDVGVSYLAMGVNDRIPLADVVLSGGLGCV
jgi:hypothetical protein